MEQKTITGNLSKSIKRGFRFWKGNLYFGVIDTQAKADSLPDVPKTDAEFAKEVQRVNREFPAAYSLMFCDSRCSCGLSCNQDQVAQTLDS
ncbi:hypothetical protein GCM10009865_02020 [Aeromicrobium ponti]